VQYCLIPANITANKRNEAIHEGGAIMPVVKEMMSKIIEEQPDDSSYDEILRELAFSRMIERGLEDSRENRVISNDEMEHRIKTWRE
jgi:hypothetical protein